MKISLLRLGIILLRIASQSKRNVINLFKKVILNLGCYDLIGLSKSFALCYNNNKGSEQR